MSIRPVPLTVALLTILAAPAAAQRWAAEVGILAPATLVDAGDGWVRAGAAWTAALARAWQPVEHLRPTVRARITSAATVARRGPNQWRPGPLRSLDVVGALAHPITERLRIDAGAGVAVFLTPTDDAAPFASLRGPRPLAEFGLELQASPRWVARVATLATPVGRDAARAQTAGTLLRVALGVQRVF